MEHQVEQTTSAVGVADAPSGPPLPPQNFGWAIAAVVFFWPLAFAVINHASAVYPRWAQGDHAGALESSAAAKRLGQIALTVWWVAAMVGLCLLVVLLVGSAEPPQVGPGTYTR